VTTSATEIKKVLAAKSFTTHPKLFSECKHVVKLVKYIYEAELLQPITAFDEGCFSQSRCSEKAKNL